MRTVTCPKRQRPLSLRKGLTKWLSNAPDQPRRVQPLLDWGAMRKANSAFLSHGKHALRNGPIDEIVGPLMPVNISNSLESIQVFADAVGGSLTRFNCDDCVIVVMAGLMHKQVRPWCGGVLKVRMTHFVHFSVQPVNATAWPPSLI
jgi:hypothetical protein